MKAQVTLSTQDHVLLDFTALPVSRRQLQLSLTVRLDITALVELDSLYHVTQGHTKMRRQVLVAKPVQQEGKHHTVNKN